MTALQARLDLQEALAPPDLQDPLALGPRDPLVEPDLLALLGQDRRAPPDLPARSELGRQDTQVQRVPSVSVVLQVLRVEQAPQG